MHLYVLTCLVYSQSADALVKPAFDFFKYNYDYDCATSSDTVLWF